MAKYSAYIDGSYMDNPPRVGYGVIVVINDEVVFKTYGHINKYIESRQVGGELESAKQVVSWCYFNGISHINIYYDYTGIQNWYTGVWRAKKPVSRDYCNYMKNYNIKINWIKVKSHSNTKFNDIADDLAKRGANMYV